MVNVISTDIISPNTDGSQDPLGNLPVAISNIQKCFSFFLSPGGAPMGTQVRLLTCAPQSACGRHDLSLQV